MTDQNHYHTLEISQNATQGEIKQAYRRLVKQFHPDSLREKTSNARIISINAAYEVLGDPQNRRVYDQELTTGQDEHFADKRQKRNAYAQDKYQHCRQVDRDGEVYLHQWYKDVYVPLNRWISQIIRPLDQQINLLAADPFDAELIRVFQEYLQKCYQYLNQAQRMFSSRPNPPKLAKVAANLYHCLNQIHDGIEELEFFTLNYDDHHLHTGKELFRIAARLRQEAQEQAKFCLN